MNWDADVESIRQTCKRAGAYLFERIPIGRETKKAFLCKFGRWETYVPKSVIVASQDDDMGDRFRYLAIKTYWARAAQAIDAYENPQPEAPAPRLDGQLRLVFDPAIVAAPESKEMIQAVRDVQQVFPGASLVTIRREQK